MQEIREACKLLEEACDVYKAAIAAFGQESLLEREVEDAAAQCWSTAEKTVQARTRACF